VDDQPRRYPVDVVLAFLREMGIDKTAAGAALERVQRV
jgi:hypothetical protein